MKPTNGYLLTLVELLGGCATDLGTVQEDLVRCQLASRASHCVAVSLADNVADKAAKAFQSLTHGTAVSYVARPCIVKRMEVNDVLLDDRHVAHLAPKACVALAVPPEMHKVTLQTGVKPMEELNGELGKLDWPQSELEKLFNRYSGVITTLDEDDGQSMILQTRRAVTPSAYYQGRWHECRT